MATAAEQTGPLSVEQALARVLALCEARTRETETVALENAFGRVLAHERRTPFALPPFANSAMDGFALRGEELPQDGERAFRLAGQVFAGAADAPACAPGECLRITTGAPMPPGADTVVIKENVRVADGAVFVRAGERAGANLRPAGEDGHAGDVVAHAGDRLDYALLGALAASGAAEVLVARRPRVALFVTGDELVPPSQPLGFGQIHDSNRYSLLALLQGLGIEPVQVAHLRDDPARLRRALGAAAAACDVVISSGGVSAGEADYLPGLVAELGQVHFWKVRMKPGMPLLCGGIGDALVFALPGNPVSTVATFLLLVQPALLALQGAKSPRPRRWKARLATALAKQHARAEFLRARLEWRDDGACWASPLAKQGSGMLRTLGEADALVALPEGPCERAAGSVVDILPLPRAGFACEPPEER